MGYIWMIVPILPILLGIALAFSIANIVIYSLAELRNATQSQGAALVFAQIIGVYAFGIISLFVVLLIGSIAIYYLIDRRNTHFRRQQQLYNTLPEFLSTKTVESNVETVSKLSHLADDSMFEEQNRPAGLWALLYLFINPITSLIIAYDLTLDLRRHEERQATYESILTRALAQTGGQSQNLPPSKLHKRDALLYLILTAITGGLFWVYWFYILLKDYNEHFHGQALTEDLILTTLKPQRPSTTCSTCGSLIPEGAKFCTSCGRPRTL